MKGIIYRTSRDLRLQFFKKQSGFCGLCMAPTPFERFFLHHDHSTGFVVFGVCQPCNIVLRNNGDDVLFLKAVGLHNVSHRLWGWGIIDILSEETLARESDWMEVNKLI